MKKHEVKLIKRTYRITEENDELIKREAKLRKISESQYIRFLINWQPLTK